MSIFIFVSTKLVKMKRSLRVLRGSADDLRHPETLVSHPNESSRPILTPSAGELVHWRLSLKSLVFVSTLSSKNEIVVLRAISWIIIYVN